MVHRGSISTMARMIRSAVWSYGAGLFQMIAAGDAITPDAARQTLFVDFHKYFFAQRILRRILTAVFLTVPTFPPGFGRQSSGTDGNVMHPPGGKNAVYASAYALHEGCGREVEKIKIPVDNCEFSTLSTTLSTRLFHKQGGLWISTPGFT